jgi:virulence-associated protein VagC
LRHIRSILYALVLAPVLWVLTGVGFNHDLTTRGRGTFAVESYAGLLLLLLAGAAYGILVFAPVSPAGPLVAGLSFLGIAVWALSAPDSYAGAFSPSVTKDGFDLSRPGYGLAALLAVPLICTALSARRWARYEPPVLPIIGVIGRARGAAAVAGTPVAVLQTQVIGPPSGVSPGGSEPTTVLRLPTADSENTTVLSGSSDQTTVAASRTDFAAEVAARSASLAQPATVSHSEPATVSLAEPATASQPEPATVSLAEPATVSLAEPATASDEEPVTLANDAGDPTIAVVTRADEPSTAIVVSADETVDVVATPAGADDRTAGGEEGVTEAVESEAVAQTSVATPVADEGDERTQAIRLPDGIDGDRTQAIRLPDGIDGDRTQAIRMPVVDDQDRTQALRLPASETTPAAPAGDETQVIRPVDQDRTQVIRTGLVKPPGDRTEVLKLPVADPTPSIAALEQPNLADDPTSRLVPPAAGGDGEPARTEKRSTVLNLERPPDEVADDTTRLDIPTQRGPGSSDG